MARSNQYREEGYEAGVEGYTRWENPYNPATEYRAHSEWEIGRSKGEEECEDDA